MNNPLAILQTLDRHLDHPVELTLYGRAALALGFPSHELWHKTTHNVDAIIPLAQLDQLRADAQFWDARDATNAELAERGLYMTHLAQWRCRATRGSGFGLFWEQTLRHTARHDLRAVARRMEGVARPDSARAVPAQRGTVRPISGHGRQP